MSPEQKVQNKIEKYLKDLQKEGKPLFFEKRQAGGWNYKKGLPDLYIVYNGKHIEIEIKAENGKPSEMQLMWQRRFKEQFNIDRFIVSSVDEVKNILNNV